MRLSFCLLGLFVMAGCAASSGEVAGDSTSNIEESADDAGTTDAAADGGADTDTDTDAAADGGACITATGVDSRMTVLGIGGGGETATENISSLTAENAAGGDLVVSLPAENRSAGTITRTLPSEDVSVVYTIVQNPDDFLSPTLEFDATSGSVTCGPLVNGDYPCTFTAMVLAPKDASNGTCATATLPTFTLHAAITQQ